jgi:hypothetical protein
VTTQLAEERHLYQLRTAQWRRTVQARDQRTAAINRVRALHQPMQRGALTICAHCSHWDEKRQRCLGVLTDYPCDTLHALAEPAPVSGPTATQATEPCTGQCDPTTGAFAHAVTCYEERERTGRNAGLALPEPGPPPAPTEPNNPAGLREQIYDVLNEEGEFMGCPTATTNVIMQLIADTEQPEWTPPPPGSTREQLPDHILNIVRPDLPDYLSTACQTADVVACAACYPRSGTPRPQYDELREHAERLHNRCRLNQKFTGQLCVCGCHPTEETP